MVKGLKIGGKQRVISRRRPTSRTGDTLRVSVLPILHAGAYPVINLPSQNAPKTPSDPKPIHLSSSKFTHVVTKSSTLFTAHTD